MFEGKTIKLFTVARELSIGTSTIVSFLATKGYSVQKHPMALLDNDMYNALIKEFADDKIIREGVSQNNIGKIKKEDLPQNLLRLDEYSRTKDSNKVIGDQEIINKLLKVWQTDQLAFIGKLTIAKAGAFFNEVLVNNRITFFPDGKGKVSIFFPFPKGFEDNKYYSFHAKLADKKVREKKDNIYALIVDDSFETKAIENTDLKNFSNEFFIKNIFTERGHSPQDASTIARQLSLNELELYTQTERFIFELIQNADDMPNKKYGDISVEFVLTDDFLIFIHNGLSFTDTNVEAICDAGKSTKTLDTTKTGYKGIGFKSVFSDAQIVYIHSGSFSFRFDKLNEIYQEINFYNLYDEYFKAFPHKIKDYKGKEKVFTDIKSIPWQIKPIWTPRKEYPDQVQKAIPDIFKKEVTICLYIGKENIKNKDNKGYKTIVSNLFYEPRFLLFLRNVENVSFQATDASILIKINRIGILKEIVASFSDKKQKLEYISHNNDRFQIEISNRKFNEAEIDLEIVQDNEKSHFKNKQGITVKEIPEKLAKLTNTTISFAAQILDKKIKKLDKADSILFNYLPTSDTRFEFPFLVNADFVTTTNRETIIAENKWNIYLFYNIGFYSIVWIADIARNKRLPNVKEAELQKSILNLLPKKFDNAGDIYEKFNLGYERALNEISFIPSQYENRLLKAHECLLDKTGIFENKSYYNFFKSLYPKLELVNYSLLYTSKLTNEEEYGFKTAIFEKQDIKNLYDLPDFPPANNAQSSIEFIKLLKHKDIVEILIDFKSILNHAEKLTEPENLFYDIQHDDKIAIEFDENIEFLHPLLEKEAITNPIFQEIIFTDLKIRHFSPVKYIESLTNNTSLVNGYIQDKESNIKFWHFIFRYKQQLSPDVKKKFENFVICTTEQNFMPLKECFLSSEFDTTYDIEGIASKLEISEMYFVSQEIITENKIRLDWRTFLYDCGVNKSEGLDLYFHKINPLVRSNSINEDNYLIITQFIFDVYSNNSARFTQDELNVLATLKLKTMHNGMQTANNCFFTNPLFNEILPDHQIDNQIDLKDYVVQNKDFQNWKEFFLKIKVNELTDIDILKKKIDILITNNNGINEDNVKTVWRTIFSYQDQLFNDTSYKSKIKGLSILLSNDNLEYINNPNLPIYFSKEYNSKTDIENLLLGHYDYFINPSFPEKPNDYDLWRKFFSELGVHEKITTSGSGSTFMISHLTSLSNYDFAVKFWNYFQNNFLVSEIIPNSIFGNYVKQNPTIPSLDKKTLQKPESIYSINLKEKVGDESKVCAIDFKIEVSNFLGIISEIIEIELSENDPILKYFGNLGEKYVYNYLLQEYGSKGTLRETTMGFQIENNNLNLEVIWNNKQIILGDLNTLNDSGLPFDIKIIENEEIKYLEIKSTLFDKSVFYMPASEWDFMRLNRTNYYIYRVGNVIENPQISNIFLAIDALFEGNIKPLNFPVQILIN